MKLFTKEIEKKLLENGIKQDPVRGTKDEIDFIPVVRLFTPWGGATWLLTELSPHDPDIAFGLCDLGMGFPELGSVSVSEIASIRRFGLGVERDLYFKADHPLSVYAEAARMADRIVENIPPVSGRGR